ncbi:MAG: glycosyltransferase family 2 protein [Ginsengibacter sp.]
MQITHDTSMPDEPLVSVLMTAYNREKYIAEAIESVLASTWRNFELIIVDDQSTDDTFSIAKSYVKNDERVKVYKNETNLRDYPNRNKAASYAKGKYLKFVDSDDKIYDWGLAYCIEQMEKYPQSSFGISMIDGDSSLPAVLMNSEDVIRKHLFQSTHLSTGPTGTIIERKFFEKIQGFDTRFSMANDEYFNVKVASLTPVVLLKRSFFFYRQHDAQEQNNPTGYLVYGYLARKEIIEKLNLPLTKEEINYLENKWDKEHATALIKLMLVNQQIRKVFKIMKMTDFGFVDLIKGIIEKCKSSIYRKA